ncbi:metal-dependent hydrolase [Sphingobacterium sp. 18053]|uniref:metal-dependent hydrolase n=1 Tax=Sphingobacterium sp. 18053 TaxID=2681401 RepID=UPI0013587376|nr:metal-dependent hydrolase [Sphingobacterium sp. 18053]
MFIGHFGLSFAAKKVAPKVSLAALFIATQFVDILWPVLVLSKIETVTITPGYTKMNAFEFLHFPYTHSLFMGLVWGVITALLYAFFKKDTRGAIVIGLCVLSHWFFDLIVHTTDLPITPFGESKVGFGLWNHLVATVLIETIIFFGGLFIYTSITKAKNKKGTWGLWSLVVFLLLISLNNAFGPTPTQADTTLFISLIILMAIIIVLAGWVDKNREVSLNQK